MFSQNELRRLALLEAMPMEKLEQIFPGLGEHMSMKITLSGPLNWALSLDKANYEKLAYFLKNDKPKPPPTYQMTEQDDGWYLEAV